MNAWIIEGICGQKIVYDIDIGNTLNKLNIMTKKYLLKPRYTDIEQLYVSDQVERDFPRMLENIDYTH